MKSKNEPLKVPAGIRYISQWQGFNLPNYPHIMDKQIPGCGFTEWVLTNNENTIICSPRIILMKNKEEQHEGFVYRVKGSNEQDATVDKDLNKTPKSIKLEEMVGLSGDDKKNFMNDLTKDISAYFYSMKSKNLPNKILVTYDSFRILKEVLQYMGEDLNNYRIVVDEFQSIFTDSRFKSTTEMDVVSALKGIQKVCYLSATPMMEEYLAKLDEFKDLPYYELDWETLQPGRIMRPSLQVRVASSIITPAKKIIESYKSGNFEKAYRKNPTTGQIDVIESREAVIYVNSVNNIINIINSCSILPEEVNILCANTDDNKKKIRRRLGKGYSIGKVLTQKDFAKGIKQKMFTLCTRTVYLGADFYSDNARSFILSDANVDCLAVDISLDLPQILGRQRWESNPWKNSAEFYYKPLVDKKGNKMTREKFLEHVDKKLKKTNNLITGWKEARKEVRDDFADNFEKVAKYENYKEDYVAVNRHSGPFSYPVLNNLVLIAEERSFDIQQIDYADRFSVFCSVDKIFGIESEEVNKEVKNFFNIYDSFKTAKEKLKFLCESNLSELARKRIEGSVDDSMRNYLSLGKDRLKSLSYDTSLVRKELGIITFDKNVLKHKIFSDFKISDRFSKSKIKEKLSMIYNQIGYKKTPKANDLEEWFEIKDILMTENNKRIHGFEIIKKKGEGN